MRHCTALLSFIKTTSSLLLPIAATTTANVTYTLTERSFLRKLIPFRIIATGSMASVLRHVFLEHESLIALFLGSLEHVPLPTLPRMLLAEGFQRLLEGIYPQRELRGLFEEAEIEIRKILYDLDFDATGRRGVYKQTSSTFSSDELRAYNAVQIDPLTRLLAFELRAVCVYYSKLLAVSSKPEIEAAVMLRTLIASDLRTDCLLTDVILAFEQHQRDKYTGKPLEPVPSGVADFVKESLLLERDAFGKFRFDARGDNRHLLHNIKLDDVTKTQESFSLLLDPVLQRNGNFILKNYLVYSGRWTRYEVSCSEEDPRVDLILPAVETLSVRDDMTGKPSQIIVQYTEPVCRRHKTNARESKANLDHVEIFEIANENRNRTFWEKFFMDR
ncbi:unnamed protein product [Phytomonas sp. Hart1]|nr:unnamed protein product [Phytomonas sp. Hart1]|eukprot:CCW68855.1 unnamed protein product [Phytomonas sp. isolate Hart1]